jgi:hypothetical protein
VSLIKTFPAQEKAGTTGAVQVQPVNVVQMEIVQVVVTTRAAQDGELDLLPWFMGFEHLDEVYIFNGLAHGCWEFDRVVLVIGVSVG